jgi:hypothetical protein
MTGGLGNQMFQYALYLKLTAMGRTVKFDDYSEYQLENARPIMLWCFGIDYPKASREEINEITDGFMTLKDKVRRKLTGRKSREYREKDCNFDPEVLTRTPAYLTGYFQSEKYFQDIAEKVREAFVFRPVIFENLPEERKTAVFAYEKRMKESFAVSVHIRRGDYLTSSEVYGGNCTEEYYKRAISLMKEKYPQAVFFVFSNDSVWTKKWLLENYGEEEFLLIEGSDEDSGYLDLYLMRMCRCHILANSSFSWWGAWLNPSREKCVIAPARWFNNQDCRDIYTPEMIRISAKGEIMQQ